jgi:hypothetical protein
MSESETHPCPFCKQPVQGPAIRRTEAKKSTSGLDLPGCPLAIPDPTKGGGYDVWVLVAEDATTCTYEYGGHVSGPFSK